jgi:hypothetical protein
MGGFSFGATVGYLMFQTLTTRHPELAHCVAFRGAGGKHDVKHADNTQCYHVYLVDETPLKIYVDRNYHLSSVRVKSEFVTMTGKRSSDLPLEGRQLARPYMHRPEKCSDLQLKMDDAPNSLSRSCASHPGVATEDFVPTDDDDRQDRMHYLRDYIAAIARSST